MANSDLAPLIEVLKRGRDTAKHATIRRAVTVAVAQTDDDGNTVTTTRDMERDNRIWVLEDGSEAKPVSVLNAGTARVPQKEGIPVALDKDFTGNLKIVDADIELADFMFGQALNSLFLGELVGKLIDVIWPEDKFEPLLVRADSVSGGLNVLIKPGRYEYANGSIWWDSIAPYDVSAATVSSGMKRVVLIGLDPTTNTITTASGTERSIADYDFTASDANTVANDNPGVIWLAWYQRQDGVTSFQTAFDLHSFRAFVGVDSPTSNLMPIELDYPLTIPANSQIPVRQLTVVSGGLLTIEGILDIF